VDVRAVAFSDVNGDVPSARLWSSDANGKPIVEPSSVIAGIAPTKSRKINVIRQHDIALRITIDDNDIATVQVFVSMNEVHCRLSVRGCTNQRRVRWRNALRQSARQKGKNNILKTSRNRFSHTMTLCTARQRCCNPLNFKKFRETKWPSHESEKHTLASMSHGNVRNRC
jgi:hypothetical protein